MTAVVFCDESTEYRVYDDEVCKPLVINPRSNSGSVLCFAGHASVILPQIS
jgi:hypothetical protein